MLYHLIFTDSDRKYTLFCLGVIVLYLFNSWSDKLSYFLKYILKNLHHFLQENKAEQTAPFRSENIVPDHWSRK